MLLTLFAGARSVGAWATFYAPAPGGGTGLGIAGLWWGLGAGLFSTCSCGAFLLSRTDWTERAAKISRARGADSGTDGAGESEPSPSLCQIPFIPAGLFVAMPVDLGITEHGLTHSSCLCHCI